jgi:putative oxidoreductase
MHVGRLAVRAVIGGLFIGHGTQKLFGWFGGPGVAGTEKMMRSLDMEPARQHALLAGATEAGSGVLLSLGLATPLAASAITGTMVTAIRKVHAAKGPWVTNGGYEYNAVLIAACLALAEEGPGDLSLDHLFGLERKGPQWAAAALTAGVAMSALAIGYGKRSKADSDSTYPTRSRNGTTAGDATATTSETTA